MGDLRKARKLASVAESSHSPDDRVGTFTARWARAKVEAARGELGTAEATAREAVELARSTDSVNRLGNVLTCLAEVLIEQDRPDEASPLLREALKAYEQKGNVVSATRTTALLDSLGEAALSTPDSS
jgi:tetratricopeptide (TPR) repeat protein